LTAATIRRSFLERQFPPQFSKQHIIKGHNTNPPRTPPFAGRCPAIGALPLLPLTLRLQELVTLPKVDYWQTLFGEAMRGIAHVRSGYGFCVGRGRTIPRDLSCGRRGVLRKHPCGEILDEAEIALRRPVAPDGVHDLISDSVELNQFRKKLGFVTGETLGKELAEDTPLLVENFPQVNEGGVAVWIGTRVWVALLRKYTVFANAFRKLRFATNLTHADVSTHHGCRHA
jgi:hypothetical protein